MTVLQDIFVVLLLVGWVVGLVATVWFATLAIIEAVTRNGK